MSTVPISNWTAGMSDAELYWWAQFVLGWDEAGPGVSFDKGRDPARWDALYREYKDAPIAVIFEQGYNAGFCI